ncbi:MAG TPA: hypothetical protein VER79_11330 [Candidatus Limnocylindrales bacterium]|nr:hypothetical protein [Candidatus Limnocylindrales bacterium]
MLRLLLIAALTLGVVPLQARPAPPPDAPTNAFVTNAAERGGQDTLTLNNLLTGESSQVTVSGAHYSIVGRDVVFLDDASGRVQAVGSDSEIREHPLIQPSETARRIDWISSPAAGLVAWIVTEGTPDALTTTTYTASPEGAGARLVLRDGPRAGIRAFPVAFSDDGSTLFMDYQPDTIADLTPLRQYAAMFALDLASSTVFSLPGESSCYCGGAVGSGKFVRLALAEAGFDVRVTDLARGSTTVIPSLGLADYTQAGDVLIAPGGAQAVYTLLQLVPGAPEGERLRSLWVLVDLVNGTQRLLNPDDPEPRILRPVTWLDNGQGVLLVDSAQPGTWRLDVDSGALAQVASASFIGSTIFPPGLQ